MMELVIRDNAVNFLTAQTPEGQRKIGYFDLNGDGFVTVSDELMVRNIAGSSSEVFDAVIAKLMRAVLEGADQRLDINGDVNFDQMDVNLLFAALSDGRS
jgi:hypothetical protein